MTAILGAGISGLSAAYYALNNPKITSLVIFEASNHVGGWIRSFKQPDGTIFEKGPRVMRANAHNVLELVEQLELSDKVIPIRRSHPAAGTRYIYSDNSFHYVPNSITTFVTNNTLLNKSLSSYMWNELTTKYDPKDDESIHDFIQRRFDKDLSEKLIAPIICGIYGGDTHELSAKSCLKYIFMAERNFGSVTRGFLVYQFRNILRRFGVRPIKLDEPLISKRARNEEWSIWGIEGGFEQLPQKLAKNITERGVNIKMQHNCEKLTFKKDYVELIVNGKSEKYSQVISGLPAKNLANLIQEQHPELSKELYNIPTVTMAVVNLQFSESSSPINAFGILIPPKEKIPILGVMFDSCIAPQNSKMTVMTVMMGGAWFKQYFSECSSEEHVRTVAVKHVSEILGIAEDPKAFHVSILKDCIPQYTIGHDERLQRIHKYISTHKLPLVLCGSSYKAVGVADAILSAKQAVSAINDLL